MPFNPRLAARSFEADFIVAGRPTWSRTLIIVTPSLEEAENIQAFPGKPRKIYKSEGGARGGRRRGTSYSVTLNGTDTANFLSVIGLFVSCVPHKLLCGAIIEHRQCVRDNCGIVNKKRGHVFKMLSLKRTAEKAGNDGIAMKYEDKIKEANTIVTEQVRANLVSASAKDLRGFIYRALCFLGCKYRTFVPGGGTDHHVSPKEDIVSSKEDSPVEYRASSSKVDTMSPKEDSPVEYRVSTAYRFNSWFGTWIAADSRPWTL